MQRNIALLRRFDGRADGVCDSASVTEVIDQVRAERDARNMAVLETGESDQMGET